MPDQAAPERVNPFEIFSEKVRENVVGLTYIGYLQKRVKFCGHEFVIRTLRPSEKAAIATAIKPWRETVAEGEVWQNAHVGMSLVSIDRNDEFCPPASPDLTAFAEGRLNYVTDSETGWFQPTLDYLFGQYLELEKEVLDAITEFQNLVSGSPQPFQPSADSLTEQGTSQSEIIGETQPSDIFS